MVEENGCQLINSDPPPAQVRGNKAEVNNHHHQTLNHSPLSDLMVSKLLYLKCVENSVAEVLVSLSA